MLLIIKYTLRGRNMAMGKCRECGTEVSDQAKNCPKCGASKPVRKTSLFVKLLAGIFAIGILGNVISGMSSTTSPVSDAKKATPEVVSTLAVVDPAAERISNKQDMLEMRKRLADNREKMKKFYPAKQAMTQASADYLKASLIAASRGLSKHQDDKQQAGEAKLLAIQISEQIRDMYAHGMEESFIKNGIDASVKAGGKNKDRLTISYALMSQPLVYKFQNDLNIPEQAKKFGFKKVNYTNGFESSLGKSWTVDL